MTEQIIPDKDEYWKGQVDSKLDSICKKVDRVEVKVEKIDTTLRNGGNDKPGLIGQVREINKWKNNIEKVGYAIGIAIILDVVVRVLNSQAFMDIFHHTP